MEVTVERLLFDGDDCSIVWRLEMPASGGIKSRDDEC
jgi:hypothetical protein